MKQQLVDRAGLFSDAAAVEHRRTLLSQPHVRPLQQFVSRLRAAIPTDRFVPDFDPWDGGVNATCLLLLEAPGPWAKESGFASQNNNSQTLRNLFQACHGANLDRQKTLMWNTVPWYIGTGTKVRPATAADIREALPYLAELIALLSRLRMVVLFGGKAQKVRGFLAQQFPHLHLTNALHPSDLAMNQKPGDRAAFSASLVEVAALLRTDDDG